MALNTALLLARPNMRSRRCGALKLGLITPTDPGKLGAEKHVCGGFPLGRDGWPPLGSSHQGNWPVARRPVCRLLDANGQLARRRLQCRPRTPQVGRHSGMLVGASPVSVTCRDVILGRALTLAACSMWLGSPVHTLLVPGPAPSDVTTPLLLKEWSSPAAAKKGSNNGRWARVAQ